MTMVTSGLRFPTWLVTISDLAGEKRVAVFPTWLVGEKRVSDLTGDKWVAVSDLVGDKWASDLVGNFLFEVLEVIEKTRCQQRNIS